MIVLSLFDGISAGQLALQRAGITVDKYYASEIEPNAIAVTTHNFPSTIQIGDVLNVKGKDLPKIDLLLGGSPCQGFSVAGKRLNFDDPRSKLFFEYVRLKEDCQPKWFLLENVKMKKEWSDVITKYMGVEPITIDSSLVSAQHRQRMYWTNIPITPIEDRKIFLKDIVLSDVLPVALHNLYGGFKEKSVRVFEGKSPTLRTAAGGGHIPSFVKEDFCIAVRGRYKEDGSTEQMVEPRTDGKTNTITTVEKDNMLVQKNELVLSEKAIKYMDRKVKDGRTHWDFKHHSDIENEKSATVVANFFKGIPYNVFKDWNCIRRFHPIECERLQTFPDGFTKYGIIDGKVKEMSQTQRYKMLGNSWTCDIIVEILKNMI